MLILSLDLSTKASGYAIFENQELKDYGCITAGSANLYKRIDKMIEELENILKKYSINKVAIEDVIPEDVRGNQKVFKALIYLQGFVMHLLDKYNIKDITFYTASEWRKKCGIHTGRGIGRESLKPKDKAFVKSQFNISVNDDVADAIGIGFALIGIKPKESQTIVTSDGFEFC